MKDKKYTLGGKVGFGRKKIRESIKRIMVKHGPMLKSLAKK